MNQQNILKLWPVVEALNLKGANEDYLQAIRHGDFDGTFQDYGIDTPLRIAHFLAQVLHETGGFKVMRENMNYSASRILQVFGVNRHSAAITPSEAPELAGKPQALANRVYGIGNPRKARELGNTGADDGWLYRGGGPLQITGKANYKAWGERIGVDLVASPLLIIDTRYMLLPPLLYWKTYNCSTLADKNDIRAITKVINGGYNGYDDRVAWFNRCWKILTQHEASPQSSSWEVAKATDQTKRLQEDLNYLGCTPPLIEDGRFGPNTERAVREFQKVNNLKVDGIPGPSTQAAIELRLNSKNTPEPSLAPTPPTQVPETAGGTLATLGVVGDQIVSRVSTAQEYTQGNEYLQLALGAVVVVGVALILFGIYRKHRYQMTPVIQA
jgi:putative chitinase